MKENTKSEQRGDFAPGSPVTPLRTLQYVSVCKLLILEVIKFNNISMIYTFLGNIQRQCPRVRGALPRG